MAQYVFTMNRVGKIVPPKRQILKDISLPFFPGAKIGMLGLNGSGKSTLLRIMAGVDKEYEGEDAHAGLNIGYLPQEPSSIRAHGARKRGRGAGRGLRRQGQAGRGVHGLRRGRCDSTRWAVNRPAGGHHRHGRHGFRTPVEIAADALRLPPGTQGRGAVRRREAPRRVVPAAAVQAGHAAARRTHQPPGSRVGGMAGGIPKRYTGTVVAITHDRISWTTPPSGSWRGPRRGHTWKGNYSTWLEQRANAWRRSKRVRKPTRRH